MSNKLNKRTYIEIIEEDIAVLNNHVPDVVEREHIEQVLRHSIGYYYPVMESFESAYQRAIKENGCNAGETFARSMFKAGADNLVDQAVSNGRKKHQQGMDFMKSIAIKAFKENCQRPKDTEGCECKLCVRWVAGHCELLDGFIEKLNS